MGGALIHAAAGDAGVGIGVRARTDRPAAATVERVGLQIDAGAGAVSQATGTGHTPVQTPSWQT